MQENVVAILYFKDGFAKLPVFVGVCEDIQDMVVFMQKDADINKRDPEKYRTTLVEFYPKRTVGERLADKSYNVKDILNLLKSMRKNEMCFERTRLK